MASRRTRLCMEIVLVLTFIFGAYIMYTITRRGDSQGPDYLAPQNRRSKFPPTKRRELKVNKEGEYLQYCGFTTVSICHDLELLKHLEDFMNNNHILRKVLSPLPYTSYHMTTYDIFTNNKPPIKFVQEWLDADQTRSLSLQKCIPTDDVYPIMKKAQDVWDKTGPELFTVKTNYIKRKDAGVSIDVSMEDEELMKKFDKARAEADKVFSNKYIFRPLHITLGYFYSNIQDLSDEEQVAFDGEINKLEQMLPKRFTLKPPEVCSFSTMAAFFPIVQTGHDE